VRVLVLAKAPVSGRVKTRLQPPLTAEQAADVAAAALHDTLMAALASRASERVLALDGSPGPWLPPGWRVVEQRGTTLAQRLSAAWADCDGPTVQIGMDTPQVTGTVLDDAMARLDEHDCVLGPASDGGWWALGMRSAEPSAFHTVPMSTPTTCAHQLKRLRELGLTPTLLRTLTDVDTWTDALEVAAAAGDTRFAAVVDHLRESLPMSPTPRSTR
jgi:rSAM/selenodomain-associated transferase 1